jgi:hypothetical protein
MELQCDLRGADCLKAALVRIEKYVKEHPDTPWIIGSGISSLCPFFCT